MTIKEKVGHDINNALAIALGSTDQLVRMIRSKAQTEKILKIVNAQTAAIRDAAEKTANFAKLFEVHTNAGSGLIQDEAKNFHDMMNHLAIAIGRADQIAKILARPTDPADIKSNLQPKADDLVNSLKKLHLQLTEGQDGKKASAVSDNHEKGRTQGNNTTTPEISEHMKVADQARAAELSTINDRARLHALFTQCADAIMTLAPPTWKFTSCNPAALKLFEVSSEEEFKSLGPWDLSPQMQPSGGLSSVEAPEAILKAMANGSHLFEWDHKTIHGKILNCNVLLSRIDVVGESYLQATVRNVTEEKLKSKFLNTVLQSVPSMIFVKDFKKGMSFSLLNKAGETLLGVKEDQLIGKNDYDFFPKEQADLFISKDQKVFKDRTQIKIQSEEIQTPNGVRLIETYKVPTYDQNGEPNLLIGISNDITDELQIKKELEIERMKSVKNAKLASLGEMSAGIAHEINNPLAIIEGASRLLPKFLNDPEKLNSKLEIIRKSCERIATIVLGLKKFSRSTEKIELSQKTLSSIVQEVITLVDYNSKRNTTPVFVDCRTDALILCNEVEIEQVLVNLINNAIDAVKMNSEKWVKIAVFLDKESVVLTVTDSGHGIPENVRVKLFEPFFTTKMVGEGTGLGLSISKGILDDHGATISIVTDCPNTCFEIRFPRAKGVENAA